VELCGKLRKLIQNNWKKLLIWSAAALVCLCCSYMTWHLGHYNLPVFSTAQFHHSGWSPRASLPETVELQPGQRVEQTFTAMGNIVGICDELYLKVETETQKVPAQLDVTLREVGSGEVLCRTEATIRELPEDGVLALPLPNSVTLRSGEEYCLTISNSGSRERVMLKTDGSVLSGNLQREGEKIDAVLDFGVFRTSLYSPSRLLPCMILLTDLTVLVGLALVLFTGVREHVLYFVLAVGFGAVTLFDLTPLYGFDMRFQFDSAYVVSNELLGLEGAVTAPSKENPKQTTVHYYRRNCDDYTQFQFYRDDSVSDNYVDMAAGLRHLRADAEDREMVLAETNQGFVSDQLYILYLPQAVGFALARLLGLGFLPMVQLGRMTTYGVFVLLVFFAIRSAPFGKRLFLILGLIPAVMTQTVSITRDAMILGMSFFLVAKVLEVAYAQRKPTAGDWVIVSGVSALLAPCKAVYLPIGFFWLLIVYRQFLSGGKREWKKAALCTVCAAVPIVVVMALSSSVSIFGMLADLLGIGRGETGTAAAGAGAASAAAETAAVPAFYTFSYVVSNLPRVGIVFLNTLREQLGTFLVHSIQLFEIDLGSSDLMTVLVLLVLLLECCGTEKKRECLRPVERGFGALVALGVFLLTVLAALQWTETGSYTIFGIQGRYLTPVLPLVGYALMNNRLIRISGNTAGFVKAACCVFPAVYLMNLYLWTIAR